MSAGQLIAGGSLSRTTTRCWQLAVLPLTSIAVHVTRFVPSWNSTGASLVTTTAPHGSDATGVPRLTLAVQEPAKTFVTTSAGQVSNGTWRSRTVIVNVHWLVLPLLSRAILVTVV